MRTNEARCRLIQARTAALKRARHARRWRALAAGCMAICLLLITGAAAWMPSLMEGLPSAAVRHSSGAASLVGSHTAMGYILMGLLAFLLGVCVTILLYRLRRRNERREDKDDEL